LCFWHVSNKTFEVGENNSPITFSPFLVAN